MSKNLYPELLKSGGVKALKELGIVIMRVMEKEQETARTNLNPEYPRPKTILFRVEQSAAHSNQLDRFI